jgi:cyclopropane fatty-acyl-phospholipid synthase-like methyltransferase
MSAKERVLDTSSVEDYYDKSQKWYKWLYYDNESLGMHHGFWFKGTKSRKEALINQYKELARLLKFRKGDLVLDAGCGVGGASLWLAQHTEADFIGITVSSVQLKLAQKYANERGLQDRVKFYKMSYFNTEFKDKTFDGVFGIESFCHSYPKLNILLNEMNRILKPKGKIVMSDGILNRTPLNRYEKQIVNKFVLGFKLYGCNTKKEILSFFEKIGFKKIKYIDRLEAVIKSIEEIYRIGKIMAPIKLLSALGLVSKTESENLLALDAEKKMHTLGLCSYATIYAEK